MPLHLDTRLTHCSRPALDGPTAPVNVPVVRTSTVRFRDMAALRNSVNARASGEPVSTYGRQGMETHRALEAAICELEGASRCFLAPSGLAAISVTLLALLGPGDHALVTDSVYQPVRKLDAGHLARAGIQLSYYDPLTQDIEDHLRPNTRVVYAETPGSLLFEMIDLRPIAQVCHRRGISLVVDNSWASGYLFNPLAIGADVSIMAATKYVSGHSDLMLGTIATRDPAHAARIATTHEALGIAVSPDDAYLALRGLRTLAVRMKQHERNAIAVAQALVRDARVARVYFPALETDPGHALWRRDFSGANGLLSVEFRAAGAAQLGAIVDGLKLFAIGASWGGYESLALPAMAEKLAVHGSWAGKVGVLRLHVGLDHADDLIADLRQSIDAALAGSP